MVTLTNENAGRDGFPISTVLLWTCAVVLGAWGASGWWITLQDRSLPMAIMVSATFAVAPIIAANQRPLVVHSARGFFFNCNGLTSRLRILKATAE